MYDCSGSPGFEGTPGSLTSSDRSLVAPTNGLVRKTIDLETRREAFRELPTREGRGRPQVSRPELDGGPKDLAGNRATLIWKAPGFSRGVTYESGSP